MTDNSKRSSLDLTHTLRSAMSIVDQARALILESVRRGFDFSHKSDLSLVTTVDLAVETLIRNQLTQLFPDHGILGEEFAAKQSSSRFVWIIDPIDGTLRFRHGIPLYGIILSLYDQEGLGGELPPPGWTHTAGTPLIGIIDIPGIALRGYARLGGGCFINEERCLIRDLDSLSELTDEMLSTGGSGQFMGKKEEPLFLSLLRSSKNVCAYPDCFGHLLAVRGSLGAMLDVGNTLWDYSATPLLIHEAGGAYRCFDEFVDEHGVQRYSAVFGKPKVVDWILGMRERSVQ